MLDVAQLKEQADLLGLVGKYTALTRLSGSEYGGPCPKCGGNDRFHVQSAEGWWFCRQCHEKRGDVIEFVTWLEGVSFREACERLGGGGFVAKAPTKHQSPRAPIVPPDDRPPDVWQAAARAFVASAQAELWRNAPALDYLRARGLSDATIKAAGLGYWPQEAYRPGERWGQDKRVWLPRGWVIPCEVGSELAYVKVRRLDADMQADPKSPKYVAVSGSKKRGVLYGLGDLAGHTDAILCEGEFDALLLRQHIAGMAGVVATGSATDASPGPAALLALVAIPRIWGALDTDDAGVKGFDRWHALSPRVRLLMPSEHDVTDMWRAGHNLAAWVARGIGPAPADARRAWLQGHLARLSDAAFDAGADESIPELAAWLALYAELAALEGWGACDPGPFARSEPQKGYVDIPLEGPFAVETEQSERVSTPEARLAALYGGSWAECPPLEDVPDWIAEGHTFYQDGAGGVVSMPRGAAIAGPARL